MKPFLASVVVSAFVIGPSCLAQDAKPPMPEKPGAQPPKEQPKPADGKQPEAKPAEALPTAESLFEKHIAAIGGMDALKGEKNRLVRATYVGPGRIGEGSLRIIRAAPNKFFRTLEIPGIVSQEVWCNGEEGWIRDTNNGTHKLQGEPLIDYKLQSDFLGEANYKVRYREIKTTSREKFGEADAFVVRALPREGKERTLYFDAKSGFLIGIRVAGSGGPETDSVTSISEYQKFGETMQPIKTVTKSGPGETTVIIKKIESNLTALPTTEPPDEVRNVK